MTEPVPPMAISLRDVDFAYAEDRFVLRGCSFDVPPREVFAILGPNGRGKTTLLRLVLGLLKPSAGTIYAPGPVAYVPQLFQVRFEYSVLDMVVMGRARKIGLFSQPSRKDRDHALSALATFGLDALARTPFSRLSGGQRQMVILARALASEASVVVLDEPASMLDIRNQGQVLRQITRMARELGMTVVLSTHHPQHAMTVADQCLLMFGAEDCRSGNARTMLNEHNLSQLYNAPIRRVPILHDGKTEEVITPIFPNSGT